MTIVGRLTKDAVVNTLPDNRKVVNFCIAVNDRYRSKKGGARVEHTSYFNGAYWLGEAVAEFLKKGTLVQVEGRVFATAFMGTDGEAKASLNCHVNELKLHGGRKEVEVIGRATGSVAERDTTEKIAPHFSTDEGTDDLPF